MSEESELVTVLIGTGWQVAVDQNPHTGLWHWVAWQGRGSLRDPKFLATYNEGIRRPGVLTRDLAIEAATSYALDQHAGWVDVPMEGFSDAGG